MTDEPRRAIAWFRRDLRLTDNRMLEAATRNADRVWPVFVSDPALLKTHATATGRIAWFAANLRELDDRLRETGSGLTVLLGRPEAVLPVFAVRVGAQVAFAGADEDPDAAARDDRVANAIDLRLVDPMTANSARARVNKVEDGSICLCSELKSLFGRWRHHRASHCGRTAANRILHREP